MYSYISKTNNLYLYKKLLYENRNIFASFLIFYKIKIFLKTLIKSGHTFFILDKIHFILVTFTILL